MRRITFAGLILIFAVLLAACKNATPAMEKATLPPASIEHPSPTAPPENEVSSGPVAGGSVVIGLTQQPKTLNPLLATSAVEDAVISFAVEGLVQVDADGVYTPVLAEALPEVGDDGLTLIYHLRHGVRFSNGDAFTCEDVQFTLDAIMNTPLGLSPGYSVIDSVDCPDADTAVVNLEQVYAPYLNLFQFILPKKAGDVSAPEDWDFNRHPLGTGPWVVREWVDGDHITLAKNPYYRETGKPLLDNVTLKFFPGVIQGIQALSQGKISALWGLSEADLPALAALADRVSVAEVPTGKNELLVLNLADPSTDAPADPTKAPHPILSDVRIRRAIQMAIDKQSLIDQLFAGMGRVGTSVAPVGQYACDEPPSSFDLEGAKSLLDQSGWVAGADGVREKNGVRLSLSIATTAGDALRERSEQLLVGMLKAAGIELRVENLPAQDFFAGWSANSARKHGRFDILMYTTGPVGSPDPQGHLTSNYHSASIPTAANQGQGNNFSRYINADVDAWLDQASHSTDQAQRKNLFCQIAAQINADVPRIFLYERLTISPYLPALQNYRLSPGRSDFSFGSQDWWLKP